MNLYAIEARANAATPGPWRSRDFEGWDLSGIRIEADGVHGPHQIWVADTLLDEDAAFLTHARTDVPALVAELRRERLLSEALRYESGVLEDTIKELGRRIERQEEWLANGRERGEDV